MYGTDQNKLESIIISVIMHEIFSTAVFNNSSFINLFQTWFIYLIKFYEIIVACKINEIIDIS